MRAGVVTFPGSNCDDDAVYALTRVGFDVDRLWHKDTTDLGSYDLIVLPGGFSYGDYLRCGAMASASPIMSNVKECASKGKFVLGICNGFQILCEVGLLPGALVRNSGLQFACHDVTVTVNRNDNPWFCAGTSGEALTLPIAHGDGRYIIDESEFERMKQRGQVLLTYQKNPNGSLHDVAGVCNEQKNIFGLMPHPERATDLRSRDGNKIWDSLMDHLKRAAK